MFIERSGIKSEILRALGNFPAVALLGPRQAGKTTLARQIASMTPGVVYLDLENPADLRKLADASQFLRAQAGRLSIIDEVHRTPELFAELRVLIDERRQQGERSGQFLLLGSASLDPIQKSSETLAGRIAYFELPPLHVSETTAAGFTVETHWLRGGFPDSLTARDDETSFDWRQNFIRSYLERDVPMFAPRMPAATIGRLWTMLANSQGTALNSARFAQGLGITAHTVNRYMDLLSDLLLLRRIQPWSGNLGKRLARAPRIYVRDSGLTHALLDIGSLNQLYGHPVAGPSWEGFVIENLIHSAGPRANPFYYRTADGAEIDLVFERGGKPYAAIEIKRSSAPKITAAFRNICDELEITHRMVVSGGKDNYAGTGGAHVHSVESATAALGELMRKSIF